MKTSIISDNVPLTLSFAIRRATVCVLTIVTTLSLLPSGTKAQDLRAQKVHQWNFQRADDQNSDRQPDGWRRRQDRKHPSYINIEIVSRDPAKADRAIAEQAVLSRIVHSFEAGRWDPTYIPEAVPPSVADFMDRFVLDNCLQISMDGGAAELISAPFEMDPRFSYSLSAQMRTMQLNGHSAWIELHLLDENNEELTSLRTDSITNTEGWATLKTPVTSTAGNSLRWGRVHLVVQPHDHTLLNGIAQFDNIKIYRLPRLSLTTKLPNQVVLPGQEFDVTCTAMGISGSGAQVRLEVRDFEHRLMQSESLPLQPINPIHDEALGNTAEVFVSASRSNSTSGKPERTNASHSYDGHATWSLRFDEPGLYRIHVNLGEGGQQRELLIAAMEQDGSIDAGPFGWSISKFSSVVQPIYIPDLAANFGAGWIRFPAWFDSEDTELGDELVAMCERLQQVGTVCVGVLDQPPPTQRQIFGEGNEELPAVTVFRDARAWEPVLEPVLTRMGLKLDWFQLGAAGDLSFMGNANLAEVISDIRGRMQTYSQELKLAFSWTWLDPAPETTVVPWNSINYSITPEFTARELAEYAKPLNKRREQAWVSINPIDARRYSLLDRVRDLTERMIVIREHNIAAAFVDEPFDPNVGLFDESMQAGEMLVPWRTLVMHLGSVNYQGYIQLPGSSSNHLFGTGEDGIMVLWNDVPTVEQSFFGSDVTAVDLWGRTVDVESATSPRGIPEQRVKVGPWPIILRGVDVNVCKWRQKLQLQVTNLASTLAAEMRLPLLIQNTLPQTATGKVTVISEALLRNGSAELPLQLTTGTEHPREIPIILRNDASAGEHQLRFDFEVKADKLYQFSVFRSVMLGMGDVEFQWSVNRRNDDVIELRVELLNNTAEPVSFDCKFFPIGQPYQRFQILEAKRGSTLREITLPLDKDLAIEQAWIRCEQIGTGRILNYRLGL